MTIIDGFSLQAKLVALEELVAPDDEVFIALYGPEADIGPRTEVYTTTGEVKGKGYISGGRKLEGYTSGVDGVTAYVNWTKNPVWPVSSIRAKGACIYNRSRENLVLTVIAFDEIIISTNGPFEVPMPPNGATTAVLTLT